MGPCAVVMCRTELVMHLDIIYACSQIVRINRGSCEGIACAWGADRRFGGGSCRGSFVSKVWLAETERGRLRCLSCLGSAGSSRLLGAAQVGWAVHLTRMAESDCGHGRRTPTTDSDG